MAGQPLRARYSVASLMQLAAATKAGADIRGEVLLIQEIGSTLQQIDRAVAVRLPKQE
ncbi:hypothetical protein ACFRCI_37825 [Streptomyces sp. NPDC056638]|uniref:hypothetical protein n=1 Tax=Streptomyces sp. NPDC056638 TaxID=3345887 RepID=UPI003683EE64